MPNWCFNDIRLTAPNKEEADRLIEALKEKDSKFLRFIRPMEDIIGPRTVEEILLFNRENWGCKWEAEVYQFDRIDLEIRLQASTPWCPPTNAFYHFVNAGWGVDAAYCEVGNMMVGFFDTDDEGVGSHVDLELDFSNEYWRKDLPEDVIDRLSLEEEYESWKEFRREWEEENCAS